MRRRIVRACLAAGVVLLAVVPYLIFKIYPPEITEAPEAPRWASEQLQAMGPISRREITLLVLVVCALGVWIGGGSVVDPAIAAVIVVAMIFVARSAPIRRRV